MRIIESTGRLKNIQKGCVLTIGNFDGVHLGHREILTNAKNLAEKKQTEFIVMTFEPHPVAVLYPQKAPGVLTPLELKKLLLAQFGVDCLILLKDGAELLDLSPQDFVHKFLVENISPGAVVEGHDFNFGAERAGNIDTLRKLGVGNRTENNQTFNRPDSPGFEHDDSLYARKRPRHRRRRRLGQALSIGRRNHTRPGNRQKAGISHTEYEKAEPGDSRRGCLCRFCQDRPNRR